MGDPPSEFAVLMSRVRSGDPEALQLICERYVGHIHRIVRRKLDERLRRQFDSLDFLQDVWASMVAISPDRFTFESPEQLIQYLAQMATNKVIDAHRQHLGTEKRDLNRQQVLDPASLNQVLNRQPTPSQVAVAQERWENLVNGLNPTQRSVVELLRQGHTYTEIGNRLNIHPKAIQRLVNLLSKRLET